MEATGTVAATGRAPETRPARVGLAGRSWGQHTLRAVAILAGLFFGLPVVVLVARALLDGSLAEALATPAVLDALRLSLLTTSVSLAITVTIGLPLAFVFARHRFPGVGLLEVAASLPIVLPPSVAGLALLLVFGRRGLLGAPLDILGVSVPFTTLAVVIAQVFVSAPFFIRSAKAGIAAVERDLEDAARVDGASDRQLLRAITLPLAGGALAAGMLMSWARSLGEFGATIMFAGNLEGRTQTLPLVVYGEFQGGDLDASIAAAVILVLATVAVLLAVRVFHWGRVLTLRGIG
jgi:molybdate transport system permease protein